VDNGHCKLILRPQHGHKRAGTGCEGLAALGTKGAGSDVESLFAIDQNGWKIDAIRTALESAGVEFIAENGGGSGVPLKKTKRRTR
jgi:hypothetical protein